jgi:serine/threonine protein kinase
MNVMGFDGCVRFNQLVSLANTYTSIFQVGQLLDYGKDKHGSNWTIVRDMRVTSSGHPNGRDLIRNIIDAQRSTMTRSVCQAQYLKAYNAALKRMEWYVKVKGILHGDVIPNNVLLNVTLGDVELVDWGYWESRDVRAEPLLHL